ncbi:mannose-1-phosphate guanylyltransferase/mannose-6-phosphate isomerase [Phenylobacterium hankyongense]|uniref:Mannose-1-phosphate guanylyltransferase/mannose-6-phosphate isomerase n=1 Tax=Phenylobacterium hankyongense TaxID=1813876 RepID=A0A328AYG7_9CAUL|nr:mannose-1-phosphate guanylyltransferase/mannose-6-phosphate isomerase [Phenylobacterium hankyongense]RAK59637.1 mannose-1-phosphate guanylyltransferase/mannose-6-phosphate isomerase [Phenylobacterium hankyongense]
MAKITPVIMSGGSGTRLWPVSRRASPKQFHALGGAHTLIQETALRSQGPLFDAPVVVCNAAHAEIARTQLTAAGVAPQLIMLEPMARNTAPCAVAAAAALAARDPDALLLLLPADHDITDVPAYQAVMAAGRQAAIDGALVVFGLKPSRPETGYGYIRAGAGDGPVRPVEAFVEKPDAATAARFLADPAYSWNAGMFLFSARAFLEEARRLAPEVAEAAEAAVREARVVDGIMPLGPSFETAPSISIDYAVMEKTSLAVVAPCDLGWSDVGAWQAIWELADKTASGDVFQGDVTAVQTAGCLVRSDGPPVVVAGVEGLAVIVQDGVVLVTRRDASEPLKAAVEAMKAAGRGDLL